MAGRSGDAPAGGEREAPNDVSAQSISHAVAGVNLPLLGEGSEEFKDGGFVGGYLRVTDPRYGPPAVRNAPPESLTFFRRGDRVIAIAPGRRGENLEVDVTGYFKPLKQKRWVPREIIRKHPSPEERENLTKKLAYKMAELNGIHDLTQGQKELNEGRAEIAMNGVFDFFSGNSEGWGFESNPDPITGRRDTLTEKDEIIIANAIHEFQRLYNPGDLRKYEALCENEKRVIIGWINLAVRFYFGG